MSDPNHYSAVVVINTLGQVLLGKRTEDQVWTTPAGGAEFGESPKDTARRELFEEAGIITNKYRLRELEPNVCKDGKICYVFYLEVHPDILITSKLDPDKEVKKWNWYYRDELPSGIDEARMKSIRNAYMRRAEHTDITKSLIGKLEKGGKPAEVGEVRNFGGQAFKKLANGTWERVQTETKDGKPADEKVVTKIQQYVEDVKAGTKIESTKLKSEKPLVVSVDSALSNGYSPEDFREAANIFHERHEKVEKTISRMVEAGQKPEPALKELSKVNKQLGQQFLRQASAIEDRKQKTNNLATVAGNGNLNDYLPGARVVTTDKQAGEIIAPAKFSEKLGAYVIKIKLDDGSTTELPTNDVTPGKRK